MHRSNTSKARSVSGLPNRSEEFAFQEGKSEILQRYTLQ